MARESCLLCLQSKFPSFISRFAVAGTEPGSVHYVSICFHCVRNLLPAFEAWLKERAPEEESEE